MTSIQFIGIDGALLVQTERTPPVLDCALAAVSSASFFGFAGSFAVGKAGAIALALLAAAVGYFLARRKRRFELRITRNEFVALGRVGDEFGNSRSVSVAEVRWLEYQGDTTGPDTAAHPGGMYAVLVHRSVCLLPDVDEEQTAKVIERIKEKFPEIGAQWTGRSGFGGNVIALSFTAAPGAI